MNLHDRNGHKALNLARLPIPPPALGRAHCSAVLPVGLTSEQAVEHDGVGGEEDPDHDRQARQVALDDVGASLEAGVKPMPPKPASRPECMRTSPISAAESNTCVTAKNCTIAWPWYQRCSSASLARMAAGDEARAKIQRLLVTGDNRLKQGVDPAKARESYEQALAVAREAGLEEAVRPLVEIRLADSTGHVAQSLIPASRHPVALPRFPSDTSCVWRESASEAMATVLS